MNKKIQVRRPLCIAGLVYVAAVILWVSCRGRGAPDYEAPDRKRVCVAGFVDWKERRMSQAGETAVVILSETAILQEDQVEVLERFLSDSEKIPQYKLHYLWKQNRKSLQERENAGISGVICYMEGMKMPPVGSLVVMRGEFRSFSYATNPGEFDAADYYRIMGQQGRVMKSSCIVESAAHDIFREKMYGLREYLSLLTDACYGAEDASVMKAMLLGEKGTLDKEIKELYRQNGIIHILAISGLHLSVIGMGVYGLLKKLRCPTVANIIFSIALMFCYGTMTGMGISMLRAYIMFALHLSAGLIGRTYDLFTAVTVAALAALTVQPLYIVHSGFLFSFGAVCGIGIFLPAAAENFPGEGRVRKAIFSGIAVAIPTLPVYLCFYYEFPPYSVLLNLFVIPCMTLVLAGGLVVLGAAACFLPIGEIAAYPVHWILILYEKCCRFCLGLPGSHWITGCPKLWQVIAFLGILIVLVGYNRRLSKLLFWQGTLCALLILTVRLPEGLKITMLDVGQGDCIYVAQDEGIRMLIDGGSSDKSKVWDYQIAPFLKYEGVSYLDAVAVTHPDGDHISGIGELLKGMGESGISVGALYLPDVAECGRNEAYHELESLAADAGVPVRYIGAGDRLNCGEVMLTCVHPEKGWETEDTNAYSTVLHMRYGDFSALFTGDLEGEGEKRALRIVQSFSGAAGGSGKEPHMAEENEKIKERRWGAETMSEENGLQNVTLLKVAHHGSKYSTREDFLRVVNPKIALISAGRDNRYGHPHEELLGRLEEQGCIAYKTPESGAVTVSVRGRRVMVRTFLEDGNVKIPNRFNR